MPGIEAPPVSSTALPLAAVSKIFFRLDVEVVDVIHQVLERVEQQVALQDRKGERIKHFLHSNPSIVTFDHFPEVISNSVRLLVPYWSF